MRIPVITGSLEIPTLDWRNDDVDQFLEDLRSRLSPQGDIVSSASNDLTLRVFGEDLSPQEVVRRICDEVATEGLPALLRYTRDLDGVPLREEEIRVPVSEMEAAHREVDASFLNSIRSIRANLDTYQTAILAQDVSLEPREGVRLTHRFTPLSRVGICVPGGAAAYPSSVLMTAVPAQAAGVQDLVVVAPPTENGSYNREVLATCFELGIESVYRVGGAQAVAAMAFGVQGLEPVDKIVGPGNLFVALAKKRVYGHCDIDSIAGPSEVLVIADQTAQSKFVAADLLAQAEHFPGSAVLLSTDADLIHSVREDLETFLADLSRSELAIASLNQYSGLVLVEDMDQAIRLANRMAPEHLHLQVESPDRWVSRLTNCGALFAGHQAAVALGDYVAGPSHVLPTGATARWASGLSSNDFLRPSSVIEYEQSGLENDGVHAQRVARQEGLTAHALSIQVRMKGGDSDD
ncbi:MAG: histidinol dehydrogenase [Mariniblastus sp.]|nr:histidinol dehydrogenase [Mariniblastus sp.]